MLERRMNLSEMKELLPNGFHDAEIKKFTYDIEAQLVTFWVDVWIGTMDQPPHLRERYRRGALHFERTAFFTKTENEGCSDDSMTFLFWDLEEDLEEKAKLPSDFNGKFFELSACYCQFRIGCQDVSFEWTEEQQTNRSPDGD